jgi:hypothetical protein
VPDLTPEANIPDAPADLIKCVNRPLCTKPKDEEPRTADQLVIDCARADEDRRVCSRKLLKYYEGVKAANGGKAKAAPPKPAPKKTAALVAPKLAPVSATSGEFKKLEP